MDFKALKAISDDTRFKIIRLLLNHDHCVSGLSKRIGVSDSAISQHLTVLKEANMVSSEKKGYFTHYHLNRELLKEVGSELVTLAERKPLENINYERLKKKCREEGK